MTTCAECLSALSTTRLSEIPQGSGVAQHLATCPNCSRLVTDMTYADQRLSLALDSSLPLTPPSTIAENALITQSEREDRETIAKWFRRALAVAAGIIAVTFYQSDMGKYMFGNDDFERQTIFLKCISSESAMELATPYLRSNKGRIYRAGDLSMITIQGKSQEVETALSQIERAEREAPQCQVPGVRETAPLPVPSTPKVNPSAGTQGKG